MQPRSRHPVCHPLPVAYSKVQKGKLSARSRRFSGLERTPRTLAPFSTVEFHAYKLQKCCFVFCVIVTSNGSLYATVLSVLSFLPVCLSVTLVYCGQSPPKRMDQDVTWYAGGPRPKRHCVRWGPSSPPR